MSQADHTALQPIKSLLRLLRELKGLRESTPGVFQRRGAAFIHFNVEGEVVSVDLKRPGGSGFDRYAVDTPAGQRKLVDDAKRRAGRGEDD